MTDSAETSEGGKPWFEDKLAQNPYISCVELARFRGEPKQLRDLFSR